MRGPGEMPDPRVTHCYDRGAKISSWYFKSIVRGWTDLEDRAVFNRELIWDAFFLYPAGVQRLKEDCIAAGATLLHDRPQLTEGLAKLFPLKGT